ncbi:MAG: PTS sugar transporter subunit IIC [Bacilli bacterium]|jgi:hypothetical protein
MSNPKDPENVKVEIEVPKETPVKKRLFQRFMDHMAKTTGGMATGMFATLIIGVIVGQIGTLSGISFFTGIGNILKGLMGIGIGIGIALSLKNLSPIAIISCGVAGAISTMVLGMNGGAYVTPYIDGIHTNSNPMMSYLVVVISIELYRLVFKKTTAVDLIIVPLFITAVAGALSFLFTVPLTWIVTSLGNFIQTATAYQPILMGVVISTVMGMILTAPISSVAIAVAINLGGIAGGAATVGCCTQMIGFMMMSIRDNNAGKVISVGIGTSMLQFKNILRKPLIWLPTIIVSALLGPFATTIFQLETNYAAAGMGTCALIGPLSTILEMTDNPLMAWLGVLILMIGAPALLVFLIDLLFRKLGWIKKGDLAI